MWWLLGCVNPSTSENESLPRLHAEGTRLVDSAGQEVRLRGVNIGGWAFHETWITSVDYPLWGRLRVIASENGWSSEVDDALRAVGPGEDSQWKIAFRDAVTPAIGQPSADQLMTDLDRFPSLWDDSDLPLRLVLEERFGTDGRDALLDEFMGAWFGESDVAWLSQQGFNTVRVPIGYRTLLSGSDTVPPTELVWNELALGRLDALLDACARHHMYAIIDLQESPGGHNDYSGPARLYDDPAMAALTVELWSVLSERWRDRDEVAAYSLLAEPFSAPDPAARDAMYDQLYDAIRAGGDDHLLVIHDGFMGMGTLPDPATMGWEDVVYSTHLFEWGASSAEAYAALRLLWQATIGGPQVEQQVPVFIGSFSTMVDAPWAYDALRDNVLGFEDAGWSWALWTYRRIDDPDARELWGETTGWGLRGADPGPFSRPDAYRDDEQTLADRLSQYPELPSEPNPGVLGALGPPLAREGR